MPRQVRAAAALLAVVVLLNPWSVRLQAAAPQPPSLDQAAQMAVQGLFSQCTPDRQQQNSPAVYRICRPPWYWFNNNDLVIWAHGYVDPTQPVQIPEDQLCLSNGLCIPDLVNFLSYNFATPSYAVNGLAVLPALQDVQELVSLYTQEFGAPDHVLLVGASEGGLITALSVEQHPDVFDGGLATCGPIGDFRKQVSYMADGRAVFDYFYAGLLPGSPIYFPPEVLPTWPDLYQQTVFPVVFDPANRSMLQQYMAVTKAAFQRGDLSSIQNTVYDLLWYNAYATNNAVDVLGGQPYGNMNKWYTGSADDAALNAGIARFAADPHAVAEINAHYQTTGVLSVPLVTLHTTLDDQVPYWHEVLYLQKTKASGSWPTYHENYPPTQAYGHCGFSTTDVLGAFNLLVGKAGAGSLDAQQVEALIQALGPDRQLLDLGEK